jgi:benzylsuccinate CoA-transferase BbsE subunit
MLRDDVRDGLLKGLKVVDLADERADYCSKLLADLGASVIKLERPGGDPAGKAVNLPEELVFPEKGLSFLYNNTNKLGITLDIEQPCGRDLFLSLLQRYDVLIESFPPGYLEKLRLGFDVLSANNPRMILVSVTGFGQSGPLRDHISCDLVAAASGGQMYVTGSPDSVPLKHYGDQSYFTSSLYGAIGILLALRRRSKSGRGEHIDLSLQEVVTSTLEHVMVRYFYEGIIPRREGSLHWQRLYWIMPCQGGHIHLTLFHQWETMVEWMASEGMAEDLRDEKWRDEEYRLQHIHHVIDVVRRWTSAHQVEELFEQGQRMQFPWAPLYSPQQVLDNPQLRERGFFMEIEHPDTKARGKYAGPPYQFSSSFPIPKKRAPAPGESNRVVFGLELGLQDEELERLSSMGVI